jgi:hypothetical protein
MTLDELANMKTFYILVSIFYRNKVRKYLVLALQKLTLSLRTLVLRILWMPKREDTLSDYRNHNHVGKPTILLVNS